MSLGRHARAHTHTHIRTHTHAHIYTGRDGGRACGVSVGGWLSCRAQGARYESCHTCEWVMSHVWVSHVTHVIQSCDTYKSVRVSSTVLDLDRSSGRNSSSGQNFCGSSLVLWRIHALSCHRPGITHMSHVAGVNESCHTYELSSCHTHQGAVIPRRQVSPMWVMSHVSQTWMSHFTRVNESCHVCEYVISDVWTSLVIHVKGLSYWRQGVRCHAHESCHTGERGMSHVRMSHITLTSASCYSCEWVMSHVCMGRVTLVNESCHTREWVVSCVWMRHVTCLNEACNLSEWGM